MILRSLAIFALCGAALLGGKRLLEPEPVRTRLRVTVARDASADEVRRTTEHALLAARAIERGAMETDPVIRARLSQDFAGESAEASLRLAQTLGAQRVDPWVLERLSFQGQLMLRAALEPPTPTEQDLIHYWQAHAQRFQEPARLSFVQVPLSRDRHAEGLAVAAERLREALASVAPDAAEALGDPTLLPRRARAMDEPELRASFGAAFAAALEQAALRQWVGPVPSAFGVHFVWLSERTPSRLRPLAQVRERVRADFEAETLERAYATALAELIAAYDVEIVRTGPP